MQTKLVYVLTCAPEHHYIEWALISLCSLKRIHPDAHTVLIVDDLTNELIVGERDEILNFVSEKIVANDCPADMSLNERSRFLKTSVRQRVSGNYIFIDCDTVICKSINELYTLNNISASRDNHLYLADYLLSLYDQLAQQLQKIGLDIKQESVYYSSGIMFVPDTQVAHKLYDLWHKLWLDNLSKGVYQDQPSLALANKQCGYVIHQMSDLFNCIVYTHNTFIREAHILHISSFENPSYLFSKKVLDFIQKNGINHEWVQWVISHPYGTMLPFDYAIYHSNFKQRILWIKELVEHVKGYSKYIDATCEDFPMKSRFKRVVISCWKLKLYYLGAILWMIWKRIHVFFKRNTLKDNINKR